MKELSVYIEIKLDDVLNEVAGEMLAQGYEEAGRIRDVLIRKEYI